MLQEYIPGRPNRCGCSTATSTRAPTAGSASPARRSASRPPTPAPRRWACAAANPTVDGDDRSADEGLGYRGILDIGYRFDHRDGQYKLLDVNPRIGGTFRLFVGADGMDVLRALYLDLTGQDVPTSAAQEGRRWLVEPAGSRVVARLPPPR